jgi:hypothetical protein
VQDKPQKVSPWQWLCFGDGDDKAEFGMVEKLDRHLWRKTLW